MFDEELYKLEIKEKKIQKSLKDIKVLIILNNTYLKQYEKNLHRLFLNGKIILVDNIEEIKKEMENIEQYDLIFSVPFTNEKKLITRFVKINNNTKHIILLDENVTHFDILLLNKQGNVLFLGNNLEVFENIDILDNYIDIILQQKKFKEKNIEENKKQKKQIRNKFLVYSDSIIVDNILKKALEEISVKKSSYFFEKDLKNFYINLNKNQDMIKCVILTSDVPPFDEIKMIKKISADIKILYVTSTKDNKLLDDLNKVGVDDYIYKPFEFENLVDKLKSVNGEDFNTDFRITLYSFKELLGKFNSFSTTVKINSETRNIFNEYFRYIQN